MPLGIGQPGARRAVIPCAGLGHEAPDLVGILAAGRRLDPRVHVHRVGADHVDGARDVVRGEPAGEDQPRPGPCSKVRARRHSMGSRASPSLQRAALSRRIADATGR